MVPWSGAGRRRFRQGSSRALPLLPHRWRGGNARAREVPCPTRRLPAPVHAPSVVAAGAPERLQSSAAKDLWCACEIPRLCAPRDESGLALAVHARPVPGGAVPAGAVHVSGVLASALSLTSSEVSPKRGGVATPH